MTTRSLLSHMEQVDLQRYEATGVLGIGADYEARAAVERDTGRQVVLKRPAPETVRRRMIDASIYAKHVRPKGCTGAGVHQTIAVAMRQNLMLLACHHRVW